MAPQPERDKAPNPHGSGKPIHEPVELAVAWANAGTTFDFTHCTRCLRAKDLEHRRNCAEACAGKCVLCHEYEHQGAPCPLMDSFPDIFTDGWLAEHYPEVLDIREGRNRPLRHQHASRTREFGNDQEYSSRTRDFGYDQEHASRTREFGNDQEHASRTREFGNDQKHASRTREFGYDQEHASQNREFGNDTRHASRTRDFGYDQEHVSQNRDYGYDQQHTFRNRDFGYGQHVYPSRDRELGYGTRYASRDRDYGYDQHTYASRNRVAGYGPQYGGSPDFPVGHPLNRYPVGGGMPPPPPSWHDPYRAPMDYYSNYPPPGYGSSAYNERRHDTYATSRDYQGRSDRSRSPRLEAHRGRERERTPLRSHPRGPKAHPQPRAKNKAREKTGTKLTPREIMFRMHRKIKPEIKPEIKTEAENMEVDNPQETMIAAMQREIRARDEQIAALLRTVQSQTPQQFIHQQGPPQATQGPQQMAQEPAQLQQEQLRQQQENARLQQEQPQ